MPIDLSIVIPAFNEAERIAATLARVDDFLATMGIDYEIVVVDDGSGDHTRRVVQDVAGERSAVRLIAYRDNRGKGHAVRVGMLSARGRIRLMTDADCSIPPEDMPRLLEPLVQGRAQLAIGSRYAAESKVTQEQPRWRVAWSRLCNRIIQRTVAPGIRDTQCGFKAFDAAAACDLFSQAQIDGWAFDLEILALARQRGYEIAEVGVEWQDDPRSRVSPVRDFVAVVGEWLVIRRNLRRGVYGPPMHLSEAGASGSGIPRA